MYPFNIDHFVSERPLIAATSTGHVGAAPAYLDTRFLAMQPEYEAMLRGVGIRQGWRETQTVVTGQVPVEESEAARLPLAVQHSPRTSHPVYVQEPNRAGIRREIRSATHATNLPRKVMPPATA